MIALLTAAIAGLALNLAFTPAMTQPDWALALLTAAILVHRHNWVWALPATALHDLTLHWSAGATLPALAIIPPAMIWLDSMLGAGLPQRLLLAAIACLMLPANGWPWQAALLTFLLCLVAWSRLAPRYATA